MIDATPVRISGLLGGAAAIGNPTLPEPRDHFHAKEKGPARSLRFGWNQWRTFLFPRGLLALISRQAGACPNDAASVGGELRTEFAGGVVLAFDNEEDDKDRKRRPGSATHENSSSQPPSSASRLSRRRAVSPGVGTALREAYQEALREDVPPEMLDLLGKLG